MNVSDKRMKIGIIMGGLSSEKEISLESGRHVYNQLDSEKYKKIPLFLDDESRFWLLPEALVWLNTCTDIKSQVEKEAERVRFEQLPKKIDFAFLALHGKFGEECVPALFEVVDIPNNSAGVLGGAIGMDKYFQRILLREAGLDVPKHFGIDINDWQSKKEKIVKEIKEEIGFPCIVKPSREGCSFGLTKVIEETEMDAAFKNAFNYDNLILVEEFFEGREITTTVLGNDEAYALLPTETPSKGDYLTLEEKFLPGDAQMITPPNLPEQIINKIQQDCVKAYKTMGLKVFSRIDGFYTSEGRFVILEPNTPPGLTPSTCIFHQAAEAGMTPTQFFDKVIQLGLEAHQQKIGPL